MRKVHYLHYTLKENKPEYDSDITTLYKERFNFGTDKNQKLSNKICDFISNMGFDNSIKSEFCYHVTNFFDLAQQKEIYEFNDFSLANIIYASMFRELGIKETNEKMKRFLGLENMDVFVNSDENLVLNAAATNLSTNDEVILKDEASIVSLDNNNVEIKGVYFINSSGQQQKHYINVDPDVMHELNSSDLILFSSGTLWSSIAPTLLNPYIMDCLFRNANKCVAIINNSEDKDVKNVRLDKLLNRVYGVRLLPKIKLLFNRDADNSMQFRNYYTEDACAVYNESMGCDEQKRHDPIKLAKAVFSIYFDKSLDLKKYKHIFMDFDDTIFARDPKLTELSVKNWNNYRKLNEFIDTTILSGNSFDSIESKVDVDNTPTPI